MSDPEGFAERIDTEEMKIAMAAAGVPRRCADCNAEWSVRGHYAAMAHEPSCPNAQGVTDG